MNPRPPRFIWWFVPNRKRSFPKPWTDWVRLGLVVALLLIAVAGIRGGPWLVRRLSCHDGFPTGDIWKAGHECVGLSDGPYAFGLDAFNPVMQVIDKQNRTATGKCVKDGTPVTVGVLMTMTDGLAGSRAVHELEGMAAGQLKANSTGCLHPLHLVVGQLGEYSGNGDVTTVARRMADRPEVVAVAGIGLSHQLSAEVADILAGAKIPMVSDLITAEGFDQSGSRDDHPIFDDCDKGNTYQHGIGKGYFYRVAFRVSVQIEQLSHVITGKPDFIMVPTSGADPYTCTTLPLMQGKFKELQPKGDVLKAGFDSGDPSTVPLSARKVCIAAKKVTVVYIARGRDLGRFLSALDDELKNGCTASSITVVSTSDAGRMRAIETDSALEEQRIKALSSDSFASGKVRLLCTLVTGSDQSQAGNSNFTIFESFFTEAGFDISHIDDRWAVNAYDAMTTISAALNTLATNQPVKRSQVNTVISGFSSATQSVPGAGGKIIFDNSGNRVDTLPPVVRLCPLPKPLPGQPPPRTTSVTVYPGTAADCGR